MLDLFTANPPPLAELESRAVGWATVAALQWARTEAWVEEGIVPCGVCNGSMGSYI